MKVISLSASNIMKLVAVEIVPTTNVVKITGRNEQGKTSILNALFMALGGADRTPAKPVRRGQKKGSVKVDLGDMIVTRTFTDSGTTSLVIENREGLIFKSPQTMLNTLIGRLSFDPLEFLRQDGARQLETLRQLTGLDFRKMDIEREQVYRERTNVNRETAQIKARYDAIQVPDDAPTEEVDASAIMARVYEAIAARETKSEAERKVSNFEKGIASFDNLAGQLLNRIDQLKQEIEQLEIKRASTLRNKSEQIEARDIAKATLAAIVIPDLDAIRAEVAAVEETNKLVASAKQKQALEKEYKESDAKADNLTNKLELIDQNKQEMIANAKFPLDGLGFGEDGVVYKDVPLSQASGAEQLRVGMAMAMSLNPTLKVIRVTDGSLLDSKSMAIIEEMAADNDFQVWIEICSDAKDVGIVIEEGKVLVNNYEKENADEA